jgi:hypothetical protein
MEESFLGILVRLDISFFKDVVPIRGSFAPGRLSQQIQILRPDEGIRAEHDGTPDNVL